MKSMKKCIVTKEKISKRIKLDKRRDKRRSSAGMFYTSSAGAVTSLILMLALPFLFSLFGTANTYATTSTLNISVVDSVSLNILPNGTTGTFATSDTSTNNISVRTTNGTGYTLGIKASTEGSNALNGANSTSIPSHTVSAGISEATYSTDSTYNNTWGYRPSKLNSTANSNYLPGPTSASTAITLDKTTLANPSTANNYNLAIGARVNDSTAPGAYSNVFVLTVTANPIPYTITYNKNTTDTVTNMPENVSSQIYDETVNIPGQVPARDGFNFKGWCTVQVADGGTCTGTTYNPDGGGTDLTWTLDQTASSNSLNLYAMWATSGPTLYDLVAAQSKGPQTLTDLRAAIATPSASASISSNSGVYEYNSDIFGIASDAANTRKIYYYRGILDSYGHTGNYGSDGDNDAYPNTVLLDIDNNGVSASDTCWRIVRTTGSGGIKMIYQGTWSSSNRCKNSESTAEAPSRKAFDTVANSSGKSIIGIGYTHDPDNKLVTDDTAYGTLFGSNTNYSSNKESATVKQYIEDVFWPTINSFSSKYEKSAGWCNDRTLNTNGSWITPVSDEYSVKTPYATASSGITQYFFGAYPRVTGTSSSLKPSLTCSRNNADLYTTFDASNGNKQLTQPISLLSADEAAFAGSGYSSSSTPSHTNSFLNSRSAFWLLSPYYRYSGGNNYGFGISSGGNLSAYGINISYGVRPSISLAPGISPVSGTGTTINPWIISDTPQAKIYMQDVTTAQLANLMPNNGDVAILYDKRDESEYVIAKINGYYWMTQNLRITGIITADESNFSGDDFNVSQYSLDNSDPSYSNHCDSTNGYNYSCAKDSGSIITGVWYNYYAASAGAIKTSSSTAEAKSDICPSGWHLPSGPNTTAGKDFSNLVGNTNPGWQATTTGLSIYNASTGGYYLSGAIANTERGYWWSSSSSSSASFRYFLQYRSSDGLWNGDALRRYYGFFVRCLKK